jgi:membrane-bound lytic murein transglycosylase D
MKILCLSTKISVILTIILLCAAAGAIGAEPVSGDIIAKTSGLTPAETSELQSAGELKVKEEANAAAVQPSTITQPSPEAAKPAVSDKVLEQFIIHPLSISVSSNDKKANLAIEKSFKMYTHSMKARFSMWLERSGRYIEVMQEILKEKDMPSELVFLPIVESGFSTKAYSRARAAGPWQFISGTAKRYGLVIDWWRDERKDPLKSTEAAAKYLGDLYEMFGSWSLALAAYNAGEGKIAKALRKSSSDDFWPLLGTKHIRKETKDYVPHYIAATMIANKPEEYGFNNLAYHEPFEYDEVVLYMPVDLDVIAECSDTTLEEIQELNPELRRWSTPPNVSEYTLRIPVGKADLFLKKLAMMPDEKLFTYDTYIVKKNDTLKKIAAKTKIPSNVILELNSVSSAARLAAGHELKLPPQGKYFADIDDKMSSKKSKLNKSKQKANLKSKNKAKTAIHHKPVTTHRVTTAGHKPGAKHKIARS